MRLSALLASLVLAACARPAASPSPAPRYNLVITNARVYDGAGNPWFLGDLAVRGDRIARIAPAGMLRGSGAARVIDATGLALAPGFIDIQGQSYDSFLTGDGRVVSKVTQGITTEILGEGTTPAPLDDRNIGAMGFDTTSLRLAQGFRGARGFGSWLDAMIAHGVSPNVGSFLGAETVRMYAKGMSEGAATAAELDTMRAVTRRAMEDGAFGVGSALIYPPGAYASTEELIEIAKAMAPYGGVYITHMRSEGDRVIEATREAIRIGREGGVPVEIYHLKIAGQRNWSKAPQLVAMIDSARRAGQDVAATMYPYTAGATSLRSCIPTWVAAEGKLLANLADSATRARVKAEMLAGSKTSESLCELATARGVMVVGFRDSTLKRYEGMRLDEIASRMGGNRDWVDAVIDLTIAERARLGGIFFLASDANLRMQLKQPWVVIGTDADGWNPDSTHGEMVHPRTYGTYPQLLGQLSRDEGLMPLEEAIRKSTSAVAARLSIPDRGLLREGMYADLVLFDPATIADRASYVTPHVVAAGIREVFVNGVEVVRDGRHTGAKPGRAVRGAGSRH
ncbi:MAG TPA: D-aminoacylase [Gemmatimonadaceae bacterium]|nr:D-aminoacylase [Gemmatimonadaceae bacterium]